MNDKCPTCNVSREDRPDLFFEGHEKCADCEAEEELEECDVGELRETISMLRYNLEQIHKLSDLGEIHKITSNYFPQEVGVTGLISESSEIAGSIHESEETC